MHKHKLNIVRASPNKKRRGGYILTSDNENDVLHESVWSIGQQDSHFTPVHGVVQFFPKFLYSEDKLLLSHIISEFLSFTI